MWIIIGVLIYAGIILYQALPNFKKVGKDPETFYSADRKVNKIVLVCTVTISVMSGLTIAGIPAAIYRNGIGYYACAGGVVAAFMFCTMGYRLWLYGKEYGYISPGDFLRDRYESNGLSLFASLFLFIFCIPYTTLQLVVIGDALSVATNNFVPYFVAIILGTVIITAHIFSGGMKSVAWLDTFHMFLGLGCTWIFLLFLSYKFFPGGLTEAATAVKAIKPALFSHPGPNGTLFWKGTLNLALTGAIATFVWPHIMMRSYIGKGVDNFKTMAWAMPVGYTLVLVPLSIIGYLIGPAILPNLEHSDQLMTTLSTSCPLIITFVVTLSIFAFAVSTADSILLAACTMIARDAYQEGVMKGKDVKPEKVVLIGRISIVILMILTIIFAIQKPVYVVDYAYKLASPGFGMILPAVIGGLYWKRGNKTGAWAGTAVGLIFLVLFTFFVKPLFGFSAFVCALVINTIFYVVGSMIGETQSKDTLYKFFDNLPALKAKYSDKKDFEVTIEKTVTQ